MITSSIFLEEFKPIVQIEQNVKLIPLNRYYEVEWIEPIPLFVKDFGRIAAGGTKTEQEVKKVYVENGKLAQYRAVPLDDIKISVRQPRALRKYSLRTIGAYITKATLAFNPELNILEFFQFEDEPVFFDIVNPTRYEIAMSRVGFLGYQYLLKEIPMPDVYTVVPIEAMPIATR